MAGNISGIGAALSALTAQGRFFRNTASNVANATTPGFATRETQFSSSSSGQGVTANTVSRPSASAPLLASENPFDLSLSGGGFLLTRDPGTPGGVALLRTGGFNLDANGALVDTQGRQLLGLATDASGTVTATNPDSLAALEPVRAGASTIAAPTGRIDLAANLPADAPVGQAEQISTTVVDSLGGEHLLRLDFQKTAANTFSLTASLTGGGGTVTAPAGSTTLGFDGAGRLASISGTGAPDSPASLSLTLDFTASGAEARTASLEFGSFGASSDLTQFSGGLQVGRLNADGATPAQLTGLDVDANGLVTATAANGSSVPVFQLATAQVSAPERLSDLGGAYGVTSESGSPVFGRPGSEGFGQVESGFLGLSSVDLATESTNLLIGRRAYQAATAVLRAADEIFDSTLDIKR